MERTMSRQGDQRDHMSKSDQHGSKTESTSITFAPHLRSRPSSDIGHGSFLDKETFSQLRKELFEGGSGKALGFSDDVNDLNKLISVVLKAGIEPLIRSDLTMTAENEEQITDCLKIIEAALEKSPGAIWGRPDLEIFGKPIDSPLYALIAIYLVHLGCKWRDRLGNSILSLLSIINESQNKILQFQHSQLPFSSILMLQCTDILISLESVDLPFRREHKTAITIASGPFFQEWKDLGLGLELFTFSTSLSSSFLSITLFLLEIFSCLVQDKYAISRGKIASTIRQNVTWVLMACTRVWKILMPHLCITQSTPWLHEKSTVILRFMNIIQHCAQALRRLSGPVSLEKMAASIWIRSLVDLLSGSVCEHDRICQETIAKCLKEVLWEDELPSTTRALIQIILIPKLEDYQQCNNLPSETKDSISGFLERFKDRPNELKIEASKPDLRAAKRIRLSQPHVDAPPRLLESFVTKAYDILACDGPATLGQLSKLIAENFSQLSPAQKLSLLQTIGRIPCAAVITSAQGASGISPDSFRCRTCDVGKPAPDPNSPTQHLELDELMQVVLEATTSLSRNSGLRAVAMLSLRSFLLHCPKQEYLRISSSTPGEICIHSLRNSAREVRIAAGNTISSFIRPQVDSEIRRRNFVVILECLHNILERKDVTLQETSILTLRNLAEISGDEELNIVLLRLVDYLGHPNPYISAVTYTELSKLAANLSLSPASLFRPFWRSLSVTVVKNLQSRPHIAEQLCDLLGMKVDDFLRLTETHVLPHLVLMRNRDMIARIGATYRKMKSPFDLCSEKDNLASILAFLLSQSSTDPEGMILSLLAHVDPAFQGRSLAAFVRTEPISIACELLKCLGDAREEEISRYHQALKLLALSVPRKSVQASTTLTDTNTLGCFIEEHLLGIITQFAHSINDFQIRQPILEKKRNLVALGKMIKLAEGYISSGLPQICACLRSALNIEELSDTAFASWAILITSLDGEDVEPLIDQTFAIIIRYWANFGDDGKKNSNYLVDFILKKHGQLARGVFNTVPSLSSIPGMAEFEKRICELKGQVDPRTQFLVFSRRCQNENAAVVEQALKELVPYIAENEKFLHSAVLSEQPDSVIAQLVRSLLDCCVKFKASYEVIPILSAKCLGLIGCLDPNRIESVKEKKDILTLSNFSRKTETVDFILFFLQHVLVDAFLSASNTRAQGFLAYAMQNLLKLCHLDSTLTSRNRDAELRENYQRWLALPETVRNILTPFLRSKYTVTIGAINTTCTYPLFKSSLSHGEWLRALVQDLLSKSNGDNVELIFRVCSRIIRGQDIAISSFLLPFAILNLAVSGTEDQRKEIQEELVRVLSHPLPSHDSQMRENIISCSESVFAVLDYLTRWLQGKKKEQAAVPNNTSASRGNKDPLIEHAASQIRNVEKMLSSVPPEIISKRAVECRSFSRALFHWEQYIRQRKSQQSKEDQSELEPLYQRLQDIYSQIDEPDGIEGISAQMQVLDTEQQVLEHRKTGRRVAAQSWYELQLEAEPENSEAQWNLLTCLKESGQQDVLLNQFEVFNQGRISVNALLPFAVEAALISGKWERLNGYLDMCSKENIGDFNIGIGMALRALRKGNREIFQKTIDELRHKVANSLSVNAVSSLQSCHDALLQLHALAEVEVIVNSGVENAGDYGGVTQNLDRRLDVMGVYISENQYLLGLRRAAMELSSSFTESDIAACWLKSARLAQKNNCAGQAYHHVLRAAQLGDKSATIEHARLLWKDGHHSKAIHMLKGAIAANAFVAHDTHNPDIDSITIPQTRERYQNTLTAKAHLLLAKWTDRAGQTQSEVIIDRYHNAISLHQRWEKAHYYLGKHYNKILESEKAKPIGKEAQIYLSGEAAKLVIDNYCRALAYGNKYVFQALPKVLTLWLEHASSMEQPLDPQRGNNEEFQRHNLAQRKIVLGEIHKHVRRYLVERIPPALIYTILPQLVARICQSDASVSDYLTKIVVKTVTAFPQQALWTVLALVKSSSKERASRGIICLQKITEAAKKTRSELSVADTKSMINQGQKFSDELLRLSTARVEEKASKVSLSRNLGFSHRVTPCRLTVPFQSMLTPTLPTNHDLSYLKSFRAFPRDTVTIEAVLDDAVVLSSLQKPRKITILGSDGKTYNLLCKPKDDLRKDQRLMEFNNMINRSLKRDIESSKRRMYIKTYAVTPLNEECGLIEWIDNLRTLREIVIRLLRERGITPNYNEIRHYLNEACSEAAKLGLFTSKVLSKFPPVLHEWFVEMFPDTGAWFAARLRYTRTSAVMSMVGYVLGLGDRHGENILFEEGTGGSLHVDFNCLFDKGLTFEKPELVPFRLTQNMIDAFGAYGHSGPFRKTCEISLNLLRQNEDALMTILETFLHDPTTDFIGKKRRTHSKVPDTPEGVLECVRNKLRGLLPGQSVPLSVDGQVDELINQATDNKNLAAMYIGWCAFF